MKKKIWIPIIIVVFLAVFIIPIPSGVYKDGGTREYTALTYKIVDWNRMVGADSIYDTTKVYWKCGAGYLYRRHYGILSCADSCKELEDLR